MTTKKMHEAQKQEKKEDEQSGEAHAYTPGLKVKRAMTIDKLRRLPIPGEVLHKIGDKVNYDTKVARTEISGDPEIVKVAMILGVEAEDMSRFMLKKPGDKIKEGENIAFYTALFGLIKKNVPSPKSGTIESVSEVTGQVIVRGAPIPVDVDAYLPGKIVEVVPREGAVVQTYGAFIQGIFGIGGETHGEIKVIVASNSEEITPDKIGTDCKGKVLIGGSLVTLDAMKKAVEVGASVIVVGGVRHQDLTTFTGQEIGVAITGQEEVGITLIITEGFGKMNMNATTFKLLKSFEGHLACVNGATQIRAGVLRPEIIIPHEEKEAEKADSFAMGMVPGTPVRIIRQPYFGAIGVVNSLPVELQALESESLVRVLTVKLQDGTIATVPRANVEIIEE
jgi:transcription antitermination factor NusG